ncbi:MAG: hypothetical protein LBP81_05510 [Treponema sp.]|nr:hypothetical protein [Treponema sp.]
MKNSYLTEYKRREWNGRNHLEYRYRWTKGVEIRDSRETLLVNYLYMEIWNEEKGKVTYKNAWVTDKEIREGKCPAACRVREGTQLWAWEEPCL